MLTDKQALKLAKKYINKEPIPSSLQKEFKKSGREHLLEGIYLRTAELIQDNESASKALMAHLQQILPSIAFYETLLVEEGSQEKALELYEKWCFLRIEKMAKLIPMVMRIPGLYKKVPAIMKSLLDKTFGYAAGFDYIEKEIKDGFAADMTVCPYVETCKKYGCPELAQFFCKSDDICYGNMHPKLVWGRTKTLGTGGDYCDFSLWIKGEKMTSEEFWSIYNKYCRKNQSPNCSVKDHPLSGDHGVFEIAVFKNEVGKWCIESTIERSNNSHHDEFDTEEECFENLFKKHGSKLRKIGFPQK